MTREQEILLLRMLEHVKLLLLLDKMKGQSILSALILSYQKDSLLFLESSDQSIKLLASAPALMYLGC